MTLQEVQLPGKNADPSLRPIFSKINPTEPINCLKCHGQDPHLLFEPYNIWPGFFGSISRNKIDLIQKGSSEEKYYDNLLSTLWKKDKLWGMSAKETAPSRYTKLTWKEKGLQISEIDKKLHYAPRVRVLNEAEKLSVAHSKIFDPNSFFSQKIAELNNRRILKQIVDAPHFNEFKWAIAAVGYLEDQGCDDISSFLPQTMRSKLRPFDAFTQEFMKLRKAQFEKVKTTLLENAGQDSRLIVNDYTDDSIVAGFQKLIYLGGAMGLDTDSWSTSFGGQTYNMTSPDKEVL